MSSGSLPFNAVRVGPSMAVRPPSREERSTYNFKFSIPRGREDVKAMKELLKASIVIKPFPANLSVKPRSLQPVMLLPREHFLLNMLDLSSPYGSFEPSRFFESSIKIMRLDDGCGWYPAVLIARLESDKTIYVLERMAGELFTLCHLGPWVHLRSLIPLAIVSLPEFLEKPASIKPASIFPGTNVLSSGFPGTNVSSSVFRTGTNVSSSVFTGTNLPSSVFTGTNLPPPLTTPHLHHESKMRRLAIEAIQSVVKKPPRSRSMSTASQIIPPADVPTQPPTPGQDNSESQPITTCIPQNAPSIEARETQAQSQAPKASQMDDSLGTPTVEEIFDNIRNQYFESLYNSMGSLAYFAKGPLSRARAAFHRDCDSNLEMNDLVDFLTSLVMTTTQFDKKYRETIPNIISKMKPIFQDSETEQGKGKKKRKSKMKIGRDGLYPTECDRVKKWWSTRMPQFKEDEAMTTTEPHETKLQITWLRSRETQLQMIIILEILALEPLLTPRDAKDAELPGLPGRDEVAAEVPKDGPGKKRNRIRNSLPVLVDIHADRLCIWQSTALDEVSFPAGNQPSKDVATQESPRTTWDPLKDFCLDVILPFFSARLPEKADHLSRKFGLPLMMLPPKPEPKKSEKSEPVTKPKPKPSSAAKRTASSSRPTGTLESALSEETVKRRRSMSRGPSGAIALMRSASTTMLKRENSEPLSMTSIPRAESVSSKGRPSRPTVAAPVKRISEEDKAKKDALVKAELQSAISILRRPNRDVVGKDLAEAAERRASTSLSQLKKSRKPTQHPRAPDIVKATPVGKRFTDVLGTGVGKEPTRSRSAESNGLSTIPSSSLIPSSEPRKRSHEAAFTLDECRNIPHSSASTGEVEATPAKSLTHKQSFVSVPEVDDEAILASSPIMLRKSYSKMPQNDSGIDMGELTETPVKPRAVPVPVEGLVAATPAKRRILDSTTANASKAAVENGKEPGRKMSIYERLGWDDDDLDELGLGC
ncbi:DNA replication regulator SLD3-domain-containing protein [Hypoxylon sp. FL0890]|nr:DNA replication regulator SLD3-domain-containing protein [Hypoxylon sp. FL0890]